MPARPKPIFESRSVYVENNLSCGEKLLYSNEIEEFGQKFYFCPGKFFGLIIAVQLATQLLSMIRKNFDMYTWK
jgi:hypothetical protein